MDHLDSLAISGQCLDLDANDGELLYLYQHALFMVYPSLYEGFGLPVLEAMAQSVPVVTSCGTATAEVAGDAALLVDPHDAPALAGALAEVLDSPERAAAMREASSRRAAELPWSRTADLLDAVFREAIG